MKWQKKKIGQVCDVIAGQSPEGRFYNKSDEGLPFYQGKKEFTDKFVGKPTIWTTKVTKEAQAGDILMSVRAPVGPVNLATQKICIGRGLAAIRAGKEIDRDFLFHFLKNIESKITGNLGAVFRSINKSQIEAIEISLPPLDEQKRIVEKIEKLFAKIDEAKKINAEITEELKALSASILNKAFKTEG